MTHSPSVVIARNSRAKAGLGLTAQDDRSGDAKEQAQRKITPSLDFSAAKHAPRMGVVYVASAIELHEIEPYSSIFADLANPRRVVRHFFWLNFAFFKNIFGTGSGGVKNQKNGCKFRH